MDLDGLEGHAEAAQAENFKKVCKKLLTTDFACAIIYLETREEIKKMMNRNEALRAQVFILYIKALRARRLAETEGDWEQANRRVNMCKEFLEKHPK